MSSPPMTLVTAFVDLPVKRKSQSEFLQLGRLGVLALPYPLVIYLQGWVYLTRHAIEGPRAYVHRFVLLDQGFRVRSLSEPFFFRKVGIEFCAGLAYDCTGRLVASIGIDDREAHLVYFSPAAVLASLCVTPACRPGEHK